MILYHTIKLTDVTEKKTSVFDVETRELTSILENVYTVVDDLNKTGYVLTAVDHPNYYLTKRVD